MSALISGKQHQAVLLGIEALEDVGKCKCNVVAYGQTTEEIRDQPSLWSRGEISLCTKGRVYQAVLRSILLCGYESWPV